MLRDRVRRRGAPMLTRGRWPPDCGRASIACSAVARACRTAGSRRTPARVRSIRFLRAAAKAAETSARRRRQCLRPQRRRVRRRAPIRAPRARCRDRSPGAGANPAPAPCPTPRTPAPRSPRTSARAAAKYSARPRRRRAVRARIRESVRGSGSASIARAPRLQPTICRPATSGDRARRLNLHRRRARRLQIRA